MLNKTPLELNADFRYVLEELERSSECMFVTGRAGSGKSTLLQLFRNTTRKKVVVVAPTGIAALNVRGQTIHSCFGFPPRFLTSRDIRKSRQQQWMAKLDVLVIDEISMVRADLLDAIDLSLRANREDSRPFGGVQVVLIGDLFQLPPVVASAEEKHLFETVYDSPFFFSSKVFQQCEFAMIELQKVYRQENRHFLRLLDAVRLNELDWEDLDDLNQRYQPMSSGEESHHIVLCANNARADRINQEKLAQLPSEPVSYTAAVEGTFDPRLFPADLDLRLKKGTQVMFIRNDPEGNFVNGTIGIVTETGPDRLKVFSEEPGSPGEIVLSRAEWEIIRYRQSPEDPNQLDTEVVGRFEQFPLRLAWAVTIHKSQGKTFERVVIDMDRGAFEHGQTYVALSRCRNLEGIVLRQRIRPSDIKVDERVVTFYEQYLRR